MKRGKEGLKSQLLDGKRPSVADFFARVTAGNSTLETVCGHGYAMDVTWYRPPRPPMAYSDDGF